MRAPKGKQQATPQHSLFLIYLDAVSIANNKRAVRQGALPAFDQQQQLQQQPAGLGAAQHQQQQQQQQQQEGQGQGLQAAGQPAPPRPPVGGALPPNMPDFSVRDLQFILTFVGERRQGQGWWETAFLLPGSPRGLDGPERQALHVRDVMRAPTRPYHTPPPRARPPPPLQRSTAATCSGSWCTRCAPLSTATRSSKRAWCWRSWAACARTQTAPTACRSGEGPPASCAPRARRTRLGRLPRCAAGLAEARAAPLPLWPQRRRPRAAGGRPRPGQEPAAAGRLGGRAPRALHLRQHVNGWVAARSRRSLAFWSAPTRQCQGAVDRACLGAAPLGKLLRACLAAALAPPLQALASRSAWCATR
jgi:hypothetical protein